MKSMSAADAFFITIITILSAVLVANTLGYFGVFFFGTVLVIVALSWLPVGFVSAEIIDRVPSIVSADSGRLPASIKREWTFYGWFAFCVAAPILLWAFFKLAHRKISSSK